MRLKFNKIGDLIICYYNKQINNLLVILTVKEYKPSFAIPNGNCDYEVYDFMRNQTFKITHLTIDEYNLKNSVGQSGYRYEVHSP